MSLAPGSGSLKAAIVTTIVLWLIAALSFNHPLFWIGSSATLAVLVGMYAVAPVLARLPFVQPVPRRPAAGVAAAVLCIALATYGGGFELSGQAPHVIVLGALSVALVLYKEGGDRDSGTAIRTAAPSLIAVAAIGGCLVALSTFGGLLKNVFLPLGWSYAFCQIAARRWPAFLARGWLVRALPGILLVLTPVIVIVAFTVWGRAISDGFLVHLPPLLPLLLVDSAYLAAALVMLSKSQRSPALV